VWEVVDTSTCKNGFARFSDKKTHSLTDLQSCSFWCVFVWKHSLASCEDAGNSVFRDKSFLFSETTRPPTDVCTAIALEFEEFGNCGHEFSKRRDSKFADLGARHVAHHYQDFSYAFSDTATSFWVAFEFGCEERVAIRGVVFFQEETCNCDIGRGAEEAVNPRATMEANHGDVAWAAGAIFIQICVALETPGWAVLSKNAAPVELVEANGAQTHGVACTTDVSNNCAFMVHHCMP